LLLLRLVVVVLLMMLLLRALDLTTGAFISVCGL